MSHFFRFNRRLFVPILLYSLLTLSVGTMPVRLQCPHRHCAHGECQERIQKYRDEQPSVEAEKMRHIDLPGETHVDKGTSSGLCGYLRSSAQAKKGRVKTL